MEYQIQINSDTYNYVLQIAAVLPFTKLQNAIRQTAKTAQLQIQENHEFLTKVPVFYYKMFTSQDMP